MTVFNDGLRHAKVRAARANLGAAGGQCREVVLGAFQQVEDNLTLLRQLGKEASEEDEAASAARDSQTIATNCYREVAVNYPDVARAQTAKLQVERNASRVRTRRLQARVDLIRAGWRLGRLAVARSRCSDDRYRVPGSSTPRHWIPVFAGTTIQERKCFGPIQPWSQRP